MQTPNVTPVYTLPALADSSLGGEPTALLGERELSRLRWRTRRGLLENDLFIQRFFAKFEQTLTVSQAQSMYTLMDLSDNDLLDLHLNRRTLIQVQPDMNTPEIRALLSLLQTSLPSTKA